MKSAGARTVAPTRTPAKTLLRALAKAWLIVVLASNSLAYASIEARQFATPQQAQLYQTLIKELRCLVCQNQNLADSNADLAKDLRNKTRALVVAGKSRAAVVQFMTARYGDYVLYRPPLKTSTALLWFGPFLLLAVALLIALRRLNKPAAAKPAAAALEQAEALLRKQ